MALAIAASEDRNGLEYDPVIDETALVALAIAASEDRKSMTASK